MCEFCLRQFESSANLAEHYVCCFTRIILFDELMPIFRLLFCLIFLFFHFNLNAVFGCCSRNLVHGTVLPVPFCTVTRWIGLSQPFELVESPVWSKSFWSTRLTAMPGWFTVNGWPHWANSSYKPRHSCTMSNTFASTFCVIEMSSVIIS